jgi:hypothetical protein
MMLMTADKIAKKARLEQLEPMEVVQRYTIDFHEILKLLIFYLQALNLLQRGIL